MSHGGAREGSARNAPGIGRETMIRRVGVPSVVILAAATLVGCASGSGGSMSSSERAGMGEADATGRIPCAQYDGQPMRQCNFRVTRETGGTATVVVTKPDGVTRALFFENGRFLSADTSQADGYPEYRATRRGDLTMVTVGEERYEIPDAVIYGG